MDYMKRNLNTLKEISFSDHHSVCTERFIMTSCDGDNYNHGPQDK